MTDRIGRWFTSLRHASKWPIMVEWTNLHMTEPLLNMIAEQYGNAVWGDAPNPTCEHQPKRRKSIFCVLQLPSKMLRVADRSRWESLKYFLAMSWMLTTNLKRISKQHASQVLQALKVGPNEPTAWQQYWDTHEIPACGSEVLEILMPVNRGSLQDIVNACVGLEQRAAKATALTVIALTVTAPKARKGSVEKEAHLATWVANGCSR